jgi:hypothetical protein
MAPKSCQGYERRYGIASNDAPPTGVGDLPDVPVMVRTLVASRFILDNVLSKPGYVLFECHRYDEFGARLAYIFVLCERPLESAAVTAIARHASQNTANTVVVGGGISGDSAHITWTRFLSAFGGPVNSWLPLDPTFKEHLVLLGHNQSIPGVNGRPDDLFEDYTEMALQFAFGDRVIRYGQARVGEALPDGLAFTRQDLILMYDAKAYQNGYQVTRDTIRQFADYVNAFHRKYEHYVGRLFAFLVVSGSFIGGDDSLIAQSNALYRECQVPLRFLTAEDLGATTQALAECPTVRGVLDWSDILSHTEISSAIVQRAIRTTLKDGLVR